MRLALLTAFSAHAVLMQDTPTMANIGYLALGYNIYYGNPRATQSGVDPGFRKYSGSPIFEQKYSGHTTGDQKFQLPDGFNAVRDFGCALEFSSTSTYKFSNYTDTLSVDVTVGGGAFGAKFSASTDYKSFHEHIKSSHQRMVSSTAECVVYDASVDFYAKPNTTRDFNAAIQQMSEEYGDGTALFDLFDHFGTHTLETAKMGSRYGFSSYFYEQSWTNVERTGVDVKTAASYEGKFKAGFAVDVGKTHSAQVAFDQNMSGFKEISLGTKPVAGGVEKWAEQVIKEPMPIAYSLRSLCEVFPDQTKKTNCHKAQTAAEYCTKRLKTERKDVESCQDANDMECSWDADCHGGHVCVNSRCLSGALPVTWRPNKQLCLELDGSQLVVNTCNGNANQKWIFNSAEKDNYMQIQLASDTSKCIDGNSMQNGAALTTATCNGHLSQTWARDVAVGAMYLPNGPHGNVCMDAGSGITAGKKMLVWECNKLPQQEFDIGASTEDGVEMLV